MNAAFINWTLLFGLTLLWGTSFLCVALAIESFSAIGVASLRISVGAFVLFLALVWRKQRLPRQGIVWAYFLVLGLIGNILPFSLIAWGQQHISSGLAGLLMAVMPLITMILAHFLVQGERLNPYKLSGFVMGVTGVYLLLGPTLGDDLLAVAGGIAVLLAATLYAVNAVLVRRFPRQPPLVAGAGVLMISSLIILPLWLVSGQAFTQHPSSLSLIAVIWLGAGPTGIATLIYFAIIDRAGPTFLSNINYLIPAVAFFTGVWALNEPATPAALLALGLILSGIALTRYRA